MKQMQNNSRWINLLGRARLAGRTEAFSAREDVPRERGWPEKAWEGWFGLLSGVHCDSIPTQKPLIPALCYLH